jgi:hypothetical protein
MAWYLENRLKIYFQGDSSGDVAIPGVWPPMLETRGWERPILKHFIRSEVRQVMRSLECDENVATKILEECNEDVEMAVNFMNDSFERYQEIMEECGQFDEDDDTDVGSQSQSQSQSNSTQSKEESERVSREQKRLDAFVRSGVRAYPSNTSNFTVSLTCKHRYMSTRLNTRKSWRLQRM